MKIKHPKLTKNIKDRNKKITYQRENKVNLIQVSNPK